MLHAHIFISTWCTRKATFSQFTSTHISLKSLLVSIRYYTTYIAINFRRFLWHSATLNAACGDQPLSWAITRFSINHIPWRLKDWCIDELGLFHSSGLPSLLNNKGTLKAIFLKKGFFLGVFWVGGGGGWGESLWSLLTWTKQGATVLK